MNIKKTPTSIVIEEKRMCVGTGIVGIENR